MKRCSGLGNINIDAFEEICRPIATGLLHMKVDYIPFDNNLHAPEMVWIHLQAG
jgi:hypothetical protein